MNLIKHQRTRAIGLLGAFVTGLVSTIALPVQAQQDTLGNTQFVFTEDTVVEFEVKETHGAYQSTLGITNVTTGENTVLFRETKPFDSYGTGQRQPSDPGANNTGTPIDYLGTVQGGTIVNGRGEASGLAEYTFKAGNRYTMYLESVSVTGPTRRRVESVSVDATRFAGSLDGGQQGDTVGVRISWDDEGLPRPGKDTDFDDFVLEAGGYLAVTPCPPLR